MKKPGLKYQLLCCVLLMFYMTASAGYDAEHGDLIGAIFGSVVAITTGVVAFCILEALFDGWLER